jgi:hypothetical protein
LNVVIHPPFSPMAAALPSPPSSVVFDSRYHHHSQYSMESSTVLSSAHRILDQVCTIIIHTVHIDVLITNAYA